jgi:hypothetical protein
MWPFNCLTNNRCRIPWDGGVKFHLIVKYPKSTKQSLLFLCFFDGRKVKRVKSMVFDAKRQVR